MVGIVRTEWSGTSGGPGLTQMAFSTTPSGLFDPSADGAQDAVDAVRAFWAAIVAHLPNELSLTVSPVVDDYDRSTGELIASYTAPVAPAVVTGTNSGTYAGGAGMKVVWNTDNIRFGRRIRGATYIVPAAGTSYANNGTVANTVVTSVSAAAQGLIDTMGFSNNQLYIWSRPRTVPTAREGFQTLVQTGTCSTKAAILRGRRD